MGGSIKNIFRPECPKCKSRDNTLISLLPDGTYYCQKDKIAVEMSEVEKRLIAPNL